MPPRTGATLEARRQNADASAKQTANAKANRQRKGKPQMPAQSQEQENPNPIRAAQAPLDSLLLSPHPTVGLFPYRPPLYIAYTGGP
ncbi:hypothetical protein PPGU16_41670 [Paraburkholderia largidicola]|uniref:Uncharacterized protein n=1 Tax=Paraburkholderia largidicola TaxID=3014751 RepID=A0A7I8BSR5_9BURK|nr:hypothetical protein PPGU16_41670 [Paraburkholderia sp. PGU16]